MKVKNLIFSVLSLSSSVALWAEESMYRKMYTSPPRVDLQNSTSKPLYFIFGTEHNLPSLQKLTNLGAKPPRVRLFPHYSLTAKDLGIDYKSKIIMILSDKPHPASYKDAHVYVFAPGKAVYINVTRDKRGNFHVIPQHKPKRRARKIVDGQGARVHVHRNVTKNDINKLSNREIKNLGL